MKEQKFVMITVLGATLLCSAPSFAQFADGNVSNQRCTEWGDSLETTEVVHRYNYAIRCTTDGRTLFAIKKNYEGITHVGGIVTTPGYPIYGVFAPTSPDDKIAYKNPKKWFAPKTAERSVEGCVSKVEGDNLMPANYEIFAFCASGCYTPEQMITTDPFNRSMTAQEVFSSKLPTIAGVDSSSSIDQVSLKQVTVKGWVTDLSPTNHELLNFKTLSGGNLSVTNNHPILTSNGEIKEAGQIALGDAFVKADGSVDPVVEIVPSSYYGYVYNFDIDSEEEADQLLVAQGFINGSVRFQNEDLVAVNRQILRTNIARSLVKKYGAQTKN
ncbi:MAG: hypothetical protein H7333_02310 [Bdellovibrionales bacterium]|nr:hypothetical protein [Oligoflexia bacterium]